MEDETAPPKNRAKDHAPSPTIVSTRREGPAPLPLLTDGVEVAVLNGPCFRRAIRQTGNEVSRGSHPSCARSSERWRRWGSRRRGLHRITPSASHEAGDGTRQASDARGCPQGASEGDRSAAEVHEGREYRSGSKAQGSKRSSRLETGVTTRHRIQGAKPWSRATQDRITSVRRKREEKRQEGQDPGDRTRLCIRGTLRRV